MKVRELMTRRNLLTASEDDDLELSAQIMLWAGVRHLPVKRNGKIVGMLSMRDLLTLAPTPEARGTVGDVMSSPAIVASPDDDVLAAAALMSTRKIGCLPVVERGILVGLLTVTDLAVQQVSEQIARDAAPQPTIAAAMTRSPARVRTDTSLLDAVALMVSRNVHHLPVVDGDNCVVGMLSDRDVRAAVGEPRRAAEEGTSRARVAGLRVGDVMQHEIFTVQASQPLSEGVRQLVDHRIGALPVLGDDGCLIGIVSYPDVVKVLLAHPLPAAARAPVPEP